MGAKYDPKEKKWFIDEKDRDFFSDFIPPPPPLSPSIYDDGDDEYDTLKKGKSIVLGKANSRKINKRFRDDMLETLLTFHPYKTILVSDIEYLVFKYFNNTKSIMLYYKLVMEKTERSIAYMICLRNKLGLLNLATEHRKKVNSAFRNAISNTLREKFKQSCTEENSCEKCGTTSFLEIDHKNIPFSQIMDDFIITNGLSVVDIKLSNTAHNEMDNYALKISWIHYHDTTAEYRFLCKSCNTSIGDSGYRMKKRKNVQSNHSIAS
jgi:hypothetical protein